MPQTYKLEFCVSAFFREANSADHHRKASKPGPSAEQAPGMDWKACRHKPIPKWVGLLKAAVGTKKATDIGVFGREHAMTRLDL